MEPKTSQTAINTCLDEMEEFKERDIAISQVTVLFFPFSNSTVKGILAALFVFVVLQRKKETIWCVFATLIHC